MKIGIDSYCFHRYFGEVYDNQEDPGKRITYQDFLNRAIELGVDGVSLETCFFESTEDSYFQRKTGFFRHPSSVFRLHGFYLRLPWV